MNAPDKPPTWLQAITPPFFTASFNKASAAVVPCVPTASKPISSKINATLSPTAGVGLMTDPQYQRVRAIAEKRFDRLIVPSA